MAELTAPTVVGTYLGFVPARTESNTPSAYRLARKPSGELVLQGCFTWNEGWSKHGVEWRDLPTVEIP